MPEFCWHSGIAAAAAAAFLSKGDCIRQQDRGFCFIGILAPLLLLLLLLLLVLLPPNCYTLIAIIDTVQTEENSSWQLWALLHVKAAAVVCHRNGEFIFRSSNSVKPATDLPEDMVKRVRAATQGFCTREAHSATFAPMPTHRVYRKVAGAVEDSPVARCSAKHRSFFMPDMHHSTVVWLGTWNITPILLVGICRHNLCLLLFIFS